MKVSERVIPTTKPLWLSSAGAERKALYFRARATQGGGGGGGGVGLQEIFFGPSTVLQFLFDCGPMHEFCF